MFVPNGSTLPTWRALTTRLGAIPNGMETVPPTPPESGAALKRGKWDGVGEQKLDGGVTSAPMAIDVEDLGDFQAERMTYAGYLSTCRLCGRNCGIFPSQPIDI